MPFRAESLRFRWCIVDTVVALLLVSGTITSWNTAIFETGVNSFRSDLMTWVMPYFLGRMIFRDIRIRRATLYMLIGLVAILSVAALVEFRLQPYWYLHLLQNFGMGNRVPAMAYSRFGFFRVSGTVEHPIYFGNMCLVILGMIAVLASTTGRGLNNIWVILGMLGAFGCIVTSISFTPYMGLVACALFFLTLQLFPKSRMLLMPGTLAVIAVIFAFTYHVAHSKLGPKPESDLAGSLWTRKVIISESWKKATTAGAFGYGKTLDFSEEDDFDLSSVDNSYMLFTMTRGWVYTALWISLGVWFSIRMTLAFARATHPSQIFPLSAATATVLALMISMYTVWAGALYTVVWMIMLGLSNTLIDMVVFPDWGTRPAVRKPRRFVARPPRVLLGASPPLQPAPGARPAT